MGIVHVKDPERRDHFWLLNAIAVALLTLLGTAGEAIGLDRMLKSKTVKRRTHSLFNRGAMLYELIPNILERRRRPLIEKFEELRHSPLLSAVTSARSGDS